MIGSARYCMGQQDPQLPPTRLQQVECAKEMVGAMSIMARATRGCPRSSGPQCQLRAAIEVRDRPRAEGSFWTLLA